MCTAAEQIKSHAEMEALFEKGGRYSTAYRAKHGVGPMNGRTKSYIKKLSKKVKINTSEVDPKTCSSKAAYQLVARHLPHCAKVRTPPHQACFPVVDKTPLFCRHEHACNKKRTTRIHI